MVAVPVAPFQHSPIFGHCASSHTVCRFSDRSWPVKSSYLSPCAPLCRSHPGFLSAAEAGRGPAHFQQQCNRSSAAALLAMFLNFFYQSTLDTRLENVYLQR